MPHVVSTVSRVTHQKPTYGVLPINPFHSLLISHKLIFLPISFKPTPTQPVPPRGLSWEMDMHFPNLSATKGLSLDFVDG